MLAYASNVELKKEYFVKTKCNTGEKVELSLLDKNNVQYKLKFNFMYENDKKDPHFMNINKISELILQTINEHLPHLGVTIKKDGKEYEASYEGQGFYVIELECEDNFEENDRYL